MFRTLHKLILDMMIKSRTLALVLSHSGVFIHSIVDRLQSSAAIHLRSLLTIISLVHRNHHNPRQLVLDNDLYCKVRVFAMAKEQVLVHKVAVALLRDFQMSTIT